MNHPITLLDGGMSRELMRLGAPFRQPEWSALALIEAPSFVEQVHREFIAAGAQVISTDSYALVPFHIGEERFTAEAEMLASRAGEVARIAADEVPFEVLVAGSLPPLFGSYRPDLFDADAASSLLTPLITGLAPWVDIWLAETLSSTAEARAVRSALTDDLRPLWVSFTLDDTGDVNEITAGKLAPTLRSGESIADAVACARELEAGVLLFNCSQAEIMVSALKSVRRLDATIETGAYANAFVPHAGDGGGANKGLSAIRDDLDPTSYTAIAATWVEAGATVIGGCCGIGAEHIADLSTRYAPGFRKDDQTSTG